MKNYLFLKISIRKRLPLLMCGLLLVSTVTFGWMSYVGVKNAALKVGQERLVALIEQLSSLFPTSTRLFITSTSKVAGELAVKKFLLSNGRDSAAEVSKALLKLRGDTTFIQVDLLNAQRQTVLSSKNEGIDIKVPIDSILSPTSPLMPDSGKVGKIYTYQNSIYYPVIVTVTDNMPGVPKSNHIIGYIVRLRSMKATPQALEQLSKLMGTGAKLYIGNDDNTSWTDMISIISAPPISKQITDDLITYSLANKEPVLAAIRHISNTPWLLSVELSQQKILEAARRFLLWIIISAIALLVLGSAVVWLMSNSITEPLKNLTDAASAIASGNYSTLVQDNRYDEIGKLSHAFNVMVMQLKNSQLALEKNVKEYKLLFEKNPMPIWIISKSTSEIMEANEAAISQYGYSHDEFLKLNINDLTRGSDIERYRMIVSDERGENTHSSISLHKKKDGTIMMVDVIADDLIYKNIPAKLILGNDVTEKLKAEEKLNKNAEELKNSNSELERFAYVASHDLQEPLRMVSSFLHLLEDELEGKLNETSKEYIRFAVDGALRMKVLVNDLLQYSRIGNNKEAFVATDLNEVMKYVTHVLEEEIEKNHAVLTVKPLPVIKANKTLMSQLMVNLVTNALKYHNNRPPEIEIGCTDERDEWLFYVKDNGIGIEPRYFDKIFIIFQRLHNKDEFSGTGIGLAICKKVLDVHQGKIWVESEEHVGSTFYFSIPKHLNDTGN